MPWFSLVQAALLIPSSYAIKLQKLS